MVACRMKLLASDGGRKTVPSYRMDRLLVVLVQASAIAASPLVADAADIAAVGAAVIVLAAQIIAPATGRGLALTEPGTTSTGCRVRHARQRFQVRCDGLKRAGLTTVSEVLQGHVAIQYSNVGQRDRAGPVVDGLRDLHPARIGHHVNGFRIAMALFVLSCVGRSGWIVLLVLFTNDHNDLDAVFCVKCLPSNKYRRTRRTGCSPPGCFNEHDGFGAAEAVQFEGLSRGFIPHDVLDLLAYGGAGAIGWAIPRCGSRSGPRIDALAGLGARGIFVATAAGAAAAIVSALFAGARGGAFRDADAVLAHLGVGTETGARAATAIVATLLAQAIGCAAGTIGIGRGCCGVR